MPSENQDLVVVLGEQLDLDFWGEMLSLERLSMISEEALNRGVVSVDHLLGFRLENEDFQRRGLRGGIEQELEMGEKALVKGILIFNHKLYFPFP